MKIKSIRAREILDSRGNPTIEVDIVTDAGLSRAAVPSGASTGKYEALELRDGGSRYLGKGVLNAIKNVNEIISKKIVGMDVEKQNDIDNVMIELDGTENKSKLGANAILAVSMAACKAGAVACGMKLYEYIAKICGNKKLLLPIPSMNIINGGAHAGNDLDIQEYMILPIGAKSFREAIQICSETYHTLKNILKEKYGKNAVNVGDEGGFAPPLEEIEEPIELILKAINELGYNEKIKLGLDSAASEFFKDDKYYIENKALTGDELIEIYKNLVEKYPIISLEDPFAQDDFDSYAKLVQELPAIQIVGDDLLVTNVRRIEMAIEKNACNALLLKVNQIGTVTEAIDAAKLAFASNWNVMVSHRSGETEDTFIADFVVGLGSGQIKSGAPCRGERTAKYNQLLRIEEELGKKAKYTEWKS